MDQIDRQVRHTRQLGLWREDVVQVPHAGPGDRVRWVAGDRWFAGELEEWEAGPRSDGWGGRVTAAGSAFYAVLCDDGSRWRLHWTQVVEVTERAPRRQAKLERLSR